MAEEQKNTQTIEQNISNLLNKYDITLEGNTLKSDWGLPTISADENIKKNILDVDYYWNFAGTTNPKIDVEFLITDKNKTKKWININKNDNVENTNINNYIVSASINDNGFKELNLVLYDRNFTDIQRIISNSIETFNHKSTAVDETNSTAIDEDNEITYSIDKDQVSSNIRIRYGYNDDKDTTINKESKYIGVGTWKEDQDTKYRWRTVESEYEIEDGTKLKKEEKNDLSTDNTLKNHMQQATLFSNWEEFIIIGLTTNLTNSGVKYNIKAISSANAKLNGYKMYQSYSSLRGKPKMLLASLMKMFNEQDEDHFSPIRIVWSDPDINAENAPLNGQELIYDYEEATYKALDEKEANDIKEKITKPIEDLTSYILMLTDIKACFKTNTENTLSSYINGKSVSYEKNIAAINKGDYFDETSQKENSNSFLNFISLPYITDKSIGTGNKPKNIIQMAKYQKAISDSYDVFINLNDNLNKSFDNTEKIQNRDLMKIWISNIAIKAYEGIENYKNEEFESYLNSIKNVEDIKKEILKLDIKYNTDGDIYMSENASKYLRANEKLTRKLYIKRGVYDAGLESASVNKEDDYYWKKLYVPNGYIDGLDNVKIEDLTWEYICDVGQPFYNLDYALNLLNLNDNEFSNLKKYYHDKDIDKFSEETYEVFNNKLIIDNKCYFPDTGKYETVKNNALSFDNFFKINNWPNISLIKDSEKVNILYDLKEENISEWNKKPRIQALEGFFNEIKNKMIDLNGIDISNKLLSYYEQNGNKFDPSSMFDKDGNLKIKNIGNLKIVYSPDTENNIKIKIDDARYFNFNKNQTESFFPNAYKVILETTANILSLYNFGTKKTKKIHIYKANEIKTELSDGSYKYEYILQEVGPSIIFFNDNEEPGNLRVRSINEQNSLVEKYKELLNKIMEVKNKYYSEKVYLEISKDTLDIEGLLKKYNDSKNIANEEEDRLKDGYVTEKLKSSIEYIEKENNNNNLKKFVSDEEGNTITLDLLEKAWDLVDGMIATDIEGVEKNVSSFLNNIDSEIKLRSEKLEKLNNLSQKVNNTNIGKEIELSLGSQESRNKDLKLKLTKNISSILNDYCSQCGQLISNIEEAYANQKGREVTTENGTEIVGVHKDFPRYSLTWDVIKEIEYKGHTVPIIGLHYKKPIKPKKIRKYKWGNGNNRPHCIKNISISNSSEFALMHNISTVTEINGANKTNNTDGEIVIEAENKKYSDTPSYFNMAFNTERDERVFKDMLNSINKGTITLLGDPSLRFEGDIQPYTYPIRLDIALGKETRSWSNSDGMIEDSQLSGYYVISNITHEINNAGYTTTLEIVKYPIEKNTYIGYTSPPLPEK